MKTDSSVTPEMVRHQREITKATMTETAGKLE